VSTPDLPTQLAEALEFDERRDVMEYGRGFICAVHLQPLHKLLVSAVEALEEVGGQICLCPTGRMLEPVENHIDTCGVAITHKVLQAIRAHLTPGDGGEG
jgi:hypothetical protein